MARKQGMSPLNNVGREPPTSERGWIGIVHTLQVVGWNFDYRYLYRMHFPRILLIFDRHLLWRKMLLTACALFVRIVVFVLHFQQSSPPTHTPTLCENGYSATQRSQPEPQ